MHPFRLPAKQAPTSEISPGSDVTLYAAYLTVQGDAPALTPPNLLLSSYHDVVPPRLMLARYLYRPEARPYLKILPLFDE
jgi:hypothetical protein